MSRRPAPIHNHSHFSALDGWSTPQEMIQRSLDIGAVGCGITDHGNVCGHLAFAEAAAERDVKPVFGIELYHGLLPKPGRERDQAHLIAVAKTSEGLRNLWRLVNCTGRNDHFHNVGRIFWDDLERYHEGIIFTSACALGLVPREVIDGNYTSLNRYLNILGDDFYIEISTYPSAASSDAPKRDDGFDMRLYNEALVAVAQERGIPMVYGDDGHYAFPESFEFHDAYLARQTHQSIYTPLSERKMYHPKDAVVIKDMDMIYRNLSYLDKSVIDECIDNSDLIVQSVSAQLPEVRRHLPVYVPKDSPWCSEEQKQMSPESLFIDLVVEGIESRYENPTEEVWERARYEIETLINDGIHNYFLMGWDEMKIADHLGIERGPGRGSSGGSIVAYALGITDVDPLYYGLIFERFWNSGRVDGFPDIDSDFSRQRRDEMIQALKDRWGKDRVVAIGTTGYLRPKSVIDKMYVACGITRPEADALKEIVGRTTKIDILGNDQVGWTHEYQPGRKYYVEDDVGEDIEEWIVEDDDRALLREYFVRVCQIACSRASQFGIHASGIVISDIDTDAELPAQVRGGKKGTPATMFSMSDVDHRMFVKLDVLGLRTLDVLSLWKQDMKDKYDLDIVWSGLDREDHPEEMWALVDKGFTAGIFQVEDGYGKLLCKKLHPRSVMDLAIIGAMNRPGPIQAGTPVSYLNRRMGNEKVTYPHPVFERLMDKHLSRTYGLFCFQEQVIAYFNELGYSLGESDAIRKIMGKKKPEHMDAVRDGSGDWEGKGYLDRCVELGIPRGTAQSIWEDIEGFADYCFNLSHAVEYAVITFRTIFAKYYGAPEFYTAMIRSLDPGSDGDKRKSTLPLIANECRRQHISLRLPDIHTSQADAYTDGTDVYFGFSDIAGVRASGSYIVELREHEQIDMTSPQSFRDSFDIYNSHWLSDKKDGLVTGRSPRQRLTAAKIDALEKVGCWLDPDTSYDLAALSRRQKIETEMLDVVVTDNSQAILDSNEDRLYMCDDYADVVTPWSAKKPDRYNHIDYTIPGIIARINPRVAKGSGNHFATITVEYEDNYIDLFVCPSIWQDIGSALRLRMVGIFEVRQTKDTMYGPSYSFKGITRLIER